MSDAPIAREEGRRLFGLDASLYDSARPGYPERVYAILRERCGLAAGARVVEVGPGTGRVTRRLARAGAHVTAIEPDAALASYLSRVAASERLAIDVEAASFEDARLPAGAFDLGVAATAFHWVEQERGLRKARRLLAPGGWWAMWWNVFADDTRPDPFGEATTPLLRELARGPSAGEPGRPPFALDAQTRTEGLREAGFGEVRFETIRWVGRLDTAQVRALYATFSSIARLAPRRREELLDALAAIADDAFGGRVERPFQTALYTARAPASREPPPAP
jgi:SAM-dependent methyltransferase